MWACGEGGGCSRGFVFWVRNVGEYVIYPAEGEAVFSFVDVSMLSVAFLVGHRP